MASEKPRTVAELEAEIAAARDDLAASIGALIDQVHPKAIASRSIANAQDFVGVQSARIRSQLLDSTGAVRTNRVVVLGGAAVGLLAFILIVRAIVRR